MLDPDGYYCVTANSMARERRAKLRKLARFSNLRQWVIDHILHGWSPQQNAGRMRLERHPITSSPNHRTAMRSNCGDICRSVVPDAGHGMPGAVT